MRTLHTLFVAVALTVLVTGSALAADPIIQIIHNSPSAGAAVVDIYLNAGSSPAVDDLAFRAATGLIALPAGAYTIGIAPGSSTGPGDIIASFGPVNLAEDTKTVVMAAGELGVDFNLFFNELVETAPGGEVGILAFHGAPDAPTVDIGALGVGTLFTALDYLAFQGYLNVPAADYVLSVAPTAQSPIAYFEAALSGLGGGTAVVFASGYLGTTPDFGLFAALTNGTVLELAATTSVQSASWSQIKSLYR